MALLERAGDHLARDGPPATMRAIVLDRYGSGELLRVAETATPVVGRDGLLIRVAAASLNPLDLQLVSGYPYVGRLQHGLRRPRFNGVGVDLAGTVEAIGPEVANFRPGDEVFGCVEANTSRHSSGSSGSCAEYASVRQQSIARLPANVSFRTAAATGTSALTALQGLRDQANVRPGQRVLVNGACGGVGTHAVQIAKALGAHVSAVCRAPNVELVRSLGADDVIDDEHVDFTFGGHRYDAILDHHGNRTLAECRRIMHRDAVYVAAFGRHDHRWLGTTPQLLKMYVVRPFVSQDLVGWSARPNTEDLTFLAGLLETRRLRSVIERTYPLCDIGCALRQLESGQPRGKIVITL